MAYWTKYSMVLLGVSAVLAGCASRPSYRTNVPEIYTVQAGDSLSRIAYRYGLNYHTIAQMNQIADINKIYPGQRLRLKPGRTSAAVTARTAPVNQNTSVVRQSLPTNIQTAAPTRPATPQGNRNLANMAQTAYVPPNPTYVKPVSSAQLQQQVHNSQSEFIWYAPIKAPIAQNYQASGHKGISFATQEGRSVYAITSGTVVYAGSGLTKYGNVIIINHGNGYTSAYAFNRTLLVKKDDHVFAGQKIAETGTRPSNASEPQFKLVRHGQNINPVTVLPLQS